jgi:hypothetical protein
MPGPLTATERLTSPSPSHSKLANTPSYSQERPSVFAAVEGPPIWQLPRTALQGTILNAGA